MKRANESGTTASIQPRIKSITCALTPAERLPPMSLDPMTLHIPPQILAVTGPVVHRSSPHHGRSGLVLLLQNASDQRFVLKVARGAYRMQELALEYDVLKLLHGTEVPVPRALAHVQNRPLGFLLLGQVAGRSATDVLREAGSSDDRDRIARALGSMLSTLHHLPVGAASWQDCVDGQLLWAERHLQEKVMSRAEFRAKGITGDPVKELEHLKETCPAPGTVAVLHGDFRPRNVLLEEGRITSVLDWSFTDLGDPWYDLATMFGYLDLDGQQVFLNAYGLEAVDRKRLAWFRSLSVYLAV
ncbi:MAG TPA: phosphotransferase [Clostridia bacterium]|nr:phosphotransferase [Clostridia bacterium]